MGALSEMRVSCTTTRKPLKPLLRMLGGKSTFSLHQYLLCAVNQVFTITSVSLVWTVVPELFPQSTLSKDTWDPSQNL